MSNRSKHIFVRPLRSQDAEQFFQWAMKNRIRSSFDADVLTYASTSTLCAFNAEGPLAYMPVQRPYMLESVAPRPGASEDQIAAALKEILQAVVTASYPQGCGEIYFLASDARTAAFAERHVLFEKVPHAVYRLKLKNLEPDTKE